MDFPDRLQREATYFSHQDNARQRQVAWTAIPYFSERIRATLDTDALAVQWLDAHAHALPRRGLTLACGDMTGPYGFFKQMHATEVDAVDISEGQRDKFFRTKYDGTLTVNYRIGDVNTIDLPARHYDAVIVQQAFHHFEALEHVADQIAQALTTHGVFVLKDYIGPNFLQRSPRQLAACQEIWDTMPARYRTNAAGQVLSRLHVPARESLSPCEAVRAEDIMGVLADRFHCLQQHCYGGILFPLFNGFAQNYTDSADDLAFVRAMWALDRQWIDEGRVEPNFIRAVFVRKAEAQAL